jgi:hypothetical protein
MNTRLLGGWRHVADDVGALAVGLKQLPDGCPCGHGAAHLAGSCSCCADRERTADSGCRNCEALVASIRDQMDELVDGTLRFLPFVETVSAPGELEDLHEVRRQVQHIAAVFQRVETAADEFRLGCCASHLVVLKTLAFELAASTGKLNASLMSMPLASGAPGLS